MPAPRYSAVEVAKKLAELNNAKVILGSATPDIKNYYEAKNSNSLFELKHRYNNASLPKVKIVDMRLERGLGNNGIFSKYLISSTMSDSRASFAAVRAIKPHVGFGLFLLSKSISLLRIPSSEILFDTPTKSMVGIKTTYRPGIDRLADSRGPLVSVGSLTA